MDIERLLRTCKRSAKLDFIKWETTAATRGIPVAGATRLGNIVTLQDVTPRKWRELPTAIQGCKLAALEFSIDLAADPQLPPRDRLAMHRLVYELMANRLAPWSGPHLDMHVGQVGSSRQFLVEPMGRYPLPEIPTYPRATLPRYVKGLYRDETMLFGRDVRKATSNVGSKEQSQVKLYLKTRDNGCRLPERRHRIRIEATINAKGLMSVFGRSLTVSSLADIKYRDLVTHYLRLAGPEVKMRASLRPPLLSPVMHAVIRKWQTWSAYGDAVDAVSRGNYSVREHPHLRFKTLPGETDVLREAVDSLSRGMRAASRKLTTALP